MIHPCDASVAVTAARHAVRILYFYILHARAKPVWGGGLGMHHACGSHGLLICVSLPQVEAVRALLEAYTKAV
jgi:hypothetical protein